MAVDGSQWSQRLGTDLGSVPDTERLFWYLVGLSMLGDIVTTFVGLHLGLSESNPVARTAIENWSVLGMIALKAAAISVGLCCRPLLPKAYRAIIPAGLAIPWTIAVLVNLYMISTVV